MTARAIAILILFAPAVTRGQNMAAFMAMEEGQQYASTGNWTPSGLSSLNLWIDFSDTATVTTVSGYISKINDKSGQNNHCLQTSSGARPAYTAGGLDGKYVATFDGTADFLSSTNNAFTGNTEELGVFFVAMTTTLAGYRSPMNANALYSAFNPQAFQMYYDTTQTKLIDWRTGARVTNITANVYHLVAWRCWYDGDYVKLWQNGSAGTQGNGPYWPVGPEKFYIGKSQSSGSLGYHSGTIAEVILLKAANVSSATPGTITDALVQKIEGYLAWKWGLESTLPISHPYKGAPP